MNRPEFPLRAALRSSRALWAIPVLLGLEIGILLGESGAWRSEWRWALDWAGAGVFLAGPVAAGFAAWHAQRLHRSPGEPALALGRRWRIASFAVLPIFAIAALVHVVALGWIATEVFRVGTRGAVDPMAVSLQFLLLLFCVCVGAAIGFAWRGRLVPPAVALGGAFVMVQASVGVLPALWIEMAGATAPLTGLRLRADVAVLQALTWLSGLLLVWAAVTIRSKVSTGGVLLRGVAVMALVVPAAFLAAMPQERFAVVPTSSQALECAGAEPRVCVVAGGGVAAQEVQQVFASIHAAIDDRESLPHEYVQVVGGASPAAPGRQFVIQPDTVSNGRVIPERLVRYVVWNRECLMGDAPPTGEGLERVADLEAIITARLSAGDTTNLDRVTRAFLKRPRVDQETWISAALAASDSCDFQSVPEWL